MKRLKTRWAPRLFLIAMAAGSCSSPGSPSGPAPDALVPPGSGNGVVNFRNGSTQLTFQSVCLAASGTYDPANNGSRVAIPSGSDICVRASMPPGTSFRMGGSSDARFNPGPASLNVNDALFAVNIQSGTTNLVYPTFQ